MDLIDYLKRHATIKLEVRPSDIPLRGNCSAIDDNIDKKTEEEIISRINAGDDWAWCDVSIWATIKIGERGFCGYDALGGCSYANEKDFTTCDGYYPDMVNNAIAALENDIIDALKTGKLLDELGLTY